MSSRNPMSITNIKYNYHNVNTTLQALTLCQDLQAQSTTKIPLHITKTPYTTLGHRKKKCSIWSKPSGLLQHQVMAGDYLDDSTWPLKGCLGPKIWRYCPITSPESTTHQYMQTITHPTRRLWVLFSISLVLLLFAGQTQAQYCTTNLHQNTCGNNGNGLLDTLFVTGTNFRPLLPKACPSQSPYFTFGTDTTEVLRLNQGDTATITFRALGQVNISGWIDFNQNQVFDATEWIDLSRSINANNTQTIRFPIPFPALTGPTKLRIRTRALPSQNLSPDACLRFGSGNTFDFNVEIGAGAVCQGLSAPPAIQEDKSNLCVGDSATIMVANTILAGGYQWQWQTSLDGIRYQNATTNGSNTSFKFYSRNFVADSAYVRLRQICPNGADTTYSIGILLRKEAPNLCFCNTNLHRNTCDIPGYMPDSLQILNSFFFPLLPTVCAGTYYRFGTSPIEVANLEQGGAYTFSYRSPGGVSVSAFIDYNANGVFEAAEWIDLGRNSNQNALVTTPFIVLGNATVGQVGMRIRIRGAGVNNGPSDACLEFGSGFTLDFKANIYPGLGCSLSPQNQSIQADAATICGYDSTKVRIQSAPTGAGVDITWSTSVDGVNYTPDPSNKGSVYTVSGLRMLADSIFVRMEIVCSPSGQRTLTAPVLIKKSPIITCYCTNVQNNTTCGNFISYFTIVSTSLRVNYRTCPFGTRTFIRFGPRDTTTATLRRGSTYILNYRVNANSNMSAWLDNDQSGGFEGGEWTDLGRNVGPNVTSRANLVIPATAKLGLTTLRIRTRGLPSNNGNGDACTAFNSGVTYDFPVTIVPVNTDTPEPINQAASSLIIYPNPSAGAFVLDIQNQSQPLTSLTIRDLSGRISYQMQELGSDKTVSQLGDGQYRIQTTLPSGIYILEATANDRKQTIKLVIE